jgi:hypothetical protein
MLATCLISTSVNVGFDGDSIQMSFVFGRMHSVISISIEGLKVTSTSWVDATLVK